MKKTQHYIQNRVLAVTLLLAAALAPAMLNAQSAGNTGQIVGQIMDPSDAAVTGATVTVRNANTNFSRTTTTDEAGRYAATLLPLGPYEVTTNANGFKSTSQEALVTLGNTITVNVQLVIGASSETVEVKASPITLEITNAASRSVYTDVQLTSLPSAGQRIQNFAWNIPTGQIEPE